MSVTIIPRAEWGAVKPKSRTLLPPDRLDGVAVHWFGSPVAAKSHDQCAALLRSVQQGHLNNKKENYSDIAYNHAVCPHGSAYELRGFGVQTGANGFGAANRSHASIVYMAGTGDKFTPGGARDPRRGDPRVAEARRGARRQAARPLHGLECPGKDVADWLPLKAVGAQREEGPGEGRDAGLADGLRLLAAGRRRRSSETAEERAAEDPGLGLGDGLAGASDRQPDGPAGAVPRLGRMAREGRRGRRRGRTASRRRSRSRGGMR